jgi:MoxR-like ATPase
MSMKGEKKAEGFWQEEVSAIEMDMKEVQEALTDIGLGQPVMIWGAPGIGKTRVVEGYAEEHEMDCRTS